MRRAGERGKFMERSRGLNTYQKGILIVMAVMSLIFAVIYSKTIERVGYEYNDAILVPTVEDGNTVYSGKIQGEQVQFIVSDNMVVLNYGDKTYGPYTVTEDITAIPKDEEMGGSMTGIEVREADTILFRGRVIELENYCLFYNEDGTSNNSNLISYVTSDGTEWDENGNPIDKMKPSLSTIYELTQNPELTHKGIGFVWFMGVFICILNVLSILFADEFFRLKLAFSVQNVDNVEPSEWAITARYISWTAMTVMALVIYIMGLQ